MTSSPLPPARVSEHPIDPQFLQRWSPRAMSGQSLEKSTLLTLLEAARWAPSGGNGQPWRFLYAFRDTQYFTNYLDLLVPGNQVWAKQAGVLLLIASTRFQEHNGKPYGTHSFDAGAAWMSLALQGSHLGLVVHGMAGFDHDRARNELALPETLEVEAMVAIGHPAPKETLPESLRDREIPSQRKSLGQIAFEGKWTDGN